MATVVDIEATKTNVDLQMFECSRRCEADAKWTNQEGQDTKALLYEWGKEFDVDFKAA